MPGIHVNTAGAIIFASSTFLLSFTSPESLCVLLVSMSITHAMIEFIPSIFLGVPDEGTALTILPGHKMVLEGRGIEAIRIVTIGGYGAIIVTIVLLPLFAIILPPLQNIIKPYTWIILILASIYLICRLSSRKTSLFYSSALFIFSGILGWTMFQTPISSNLSLMCLFTGLFGISTILFSLNQNSIIPHQSRFYELYLNKDILKGIFAGGTTGAILGFLPGFGPAQGGILAQEISGADEQNNTKNFLTTISGLNTSDTLFSLYCIYLIGNPRSGIAVYMSYMIENFSINHLLIFTFASLIAVSISLILCLKLGDSFSKFMAGMDYKKLSIITILLMIGILYLFIFVYNGPILYLTLALISSTALGLIPHYVGVSKSHLMGVLIIPAIIVYLNIGC
ncbi:MAG: tripartite tricarboxylate transporter permease [Methanobrevibacter sp.]|nr:tripartite tricarboxylate transporter permease [Candidatus Methanovirga basalitermitum]